MEPPGATVAGDVGETVSVTARSALAPSADDAMAKSPIHRKKTAGKRKAPNLARRWLNESFTRCSAEWNFAPKRGKQPAAEVVRPWRSLEITWPSGDWAGASFC
jgi:hypothetical protein